MGPAESGLGFVGFSEFLTSLESKVPLPTRKTQRSEVLESDELWGSSY